MKWLLLLAVFSLGVFGFETNITVSPDNTVIMNEPFDWSTIGKVTKQLSDLDSKLPSKDPIYLFLDTPGGSIEDGMDMYQYIKGISRPVHTITLRAYSMGFQTVQALGDRYILENGQLMSHKARGGFFGEFGDGVSQLDARYSHWLKIINELDLLTVKRSNGKQTLESYRKQYENELWLLGQEAVSKGYADAVVTVTCTKELQQQTVAQEFTIFKIFKIKLVFSKCPTMVAPLVFEVEVLTDVGIMSMDSYLEKGGTLPSGASNSYGSVPKCVDPNITLEDVEKAKQEALRQYKQKKNTVIKSY